jgi:GntR family transcriptional regulator, transcriptional repressor for pyruvate dehydrogenase complex
MAMQRDVRFERPDRLKLSERIAQQILGQIADGALRPGDRLPTEHRLLEQFGVGRSTLREALRSLSGMGVLDIRHGHGVYVADGAAQAGLRQLDWALLLGSREMLDLVEARKALEIQIAALAAERATQAELDSMAGCLARLRAARTRQEEYAADVDFHLAVARATQNDVFVRLIRTLRDLIQRMLWQSPAQRAGRVEEHERILRAIARRDPEAAAAAAREHFRETEARARALLDGAAQRPGAGA